MEEWPEAIRNLLRLDPDTIYYGEARDAESVYGVIEAAQTGHEVLTTTHTTWPIDVLQRWKRFGVDESYLTDPTLITCLVGIRLTPLLCPECKQPYSGHRASIDPEIEEIITRYTRPEGLFSRNPAGCPACKFTGFVDVQVFLRSLRRIENSCRCTNTKGSLLPGNTGNKKGIPPWRKILSG